MALNAVSLKSRGTGVLAGFLVSLELISTAQAHMAAEGVGELANGALHPLTSPAQMLVMVGLALLLGQQVPFDLKTPARTFAPVSAIVLALTLALGAVGVAQRVLVGIALCLGVLVGLEIRVPRLARALLCAAAAVGIGLDSSVESGPTGSRIKILLGTWFVINAIVFYLAICASNGADRKWAKTGIRVLGSWIIAISLMVLAFSLRK